jgi:hypothetical protein
MAEVIKTADTTTATVACVGDIATSLRILRKDYRLTNQHEDTRCYLLGLIPRVITVVGLVDIKRKHFDEIAELSVVVLFLKLQSASWANTR